MFFENMTQPFLKFLKGTFYGDTPYISLLWDFMRLKILENKNKINAHFYRSQFDLFFLFCKHFWNSKIFRFKSLRFNNSICLYKQG